MDGLSLIFIGFTCNKICTNVNIKFTLTYLFLEKIYITFFNGSQDLTILMMMLLQLKVVCDLFAVTPRFSTLPVRECVCEKVHLSSFK